MRSFVALLGLTSLVACVADSPLLVAYDDYLDALADTSAALCRCPAAFGYGSVEACMDDPELGPPDATRRECMLDELARDDAAALPYLACASAAEHALARCLMTSPDCADMPDAVYACVERDLDARERCAMPAPELDAALARCSSLARVELIELVE